MYKKWLTQKPENINGLKSILTLVFIGVVGGAILSVTPELVKSMISQLGLSPQQAGNLISAELGGMALATLPALYWIKRLNWRIVLLIAIAITIIGNTLTCFLQNYNSLLVLRCIVGFATGSAMIICLAGISQTEKSEPVYGLWVVGQLLFTTLGLTILPHVIPHTGLEIIFITVSLMALILALLVPNIPAKPLVTDSAVNSQSGSKLILSLLGWCAVFSFYIGIISVWVFSKLIGEHLGFSSYDVGNALAISGLVGIVAAISATLLSDKLGYAQPVTIGISLGVAGLYLILSEPDYLMFALGIGLFHFTWNFVLPYLMSLLASLDTNGRLMAMVNLAIGGGLATGPVIAGYLVETEGLISPIWLGIVLLLCCNLLIAPIFLNKTRIPQKISISH